MGGMKAVSSEPLWYGLQSALEGDVPLVLVNHYGVGAALCLHRVLLGALMLRLEIAGSSLEVALGTSF